MRAKHAHRTAGSRILPATGRIMSFTTLILAALAALVLIVLPLATGSQTYSVLTNSMKPHYGPGTLLVIQPTPFAELRTGDVVTYQIASGRSEVITHRITSVGTDQQGNSLLVTKGDNNDVADEAPVTEIQVRGKLLYAVPFAGYAANWLGNQDRGLATQFGAIALIGYGAISMTRALLVRRTKSRQQESTT
ncbi:signal peptidase I [Paeniglutamicibacter sp. ORCA_105]|uniref:signal peptidase I n=1 Tax=Paeniglutamicibacter sp. ORCA_105 TaxID=3377336 RepID=UPI003895CD29